MVQELCTEVSERVARWEQTATDATRAMDGGTAGKPRNKKFDGRVETNAGILGPGSNKRIRGIINAVSELGVQSVDLVLYPDAYTLTGYKDAARSPEWRESTIGEREALDKRERWEIVRIPL